MIMRNRYERHHRNIIKAKGIDMKKIIMKKVKIEDQTIYTAEDLYTPRKADLDKNLINLLWVFVIVMVLITLLN